MPKFGAESVKGFLHADGMKIVNEDNEEVILESYGTANWMNPEGFLCGSPIPLFETIVGYEKKVVKPLPWDRRRTMNQVLIDLAGEDYAKTFWPRWEKNHLMEGDIKAMSEVGLNSVRLVLNSASLLKEGPGMVWIEEGFENIDHVLDWCEKYKVYAILDMHAAPGGQSALACDAGYDTRPRLFYEEESWNRCLAIWEKLAERYKDRWIVGAYELLNEPLSSPLDLEILPKLGQFYDAAIAVIRKHDKKHMFSLEGAFYSTDCTVYDHDFDPECHNWSIHFHKYGFSPEKNELYPYLEKALEWNVPIWIGEGGSSPEANSVFYNIVKDYHVGYSLWCWKSATKDGRTTRCVGHKLPEGWEKVEGYILGSGNRPTYEEAARIFDEYLENLKFENCITNFDPIRTTTRQVPFDLSAVGYDNSEGSFVRSWDYGNLLNYRTEDRTKLIFDTNLPHPMKTGHLKLNQGPGPRGGNPSENPLEALLIELAVGEHAVYTYRKAPENSAVILEGKSPKGCRMTVYCNDEVIGEAVLEPSEKTMQKCAPLAIHTGAGKIKVVVSEGVAQLKKLHFEVL